MVVAESESPREVRLVAVEVLPEPLPQRLQRLEAIAIYFRLDGMTTERYDKILGSPRP